VTRVARSQSHDQCRIPDAARGCGAFHHDAVLGPRSELRERYAIGWLAVATLLLITACFQKTQSHRRLGASELSGVVLFVALGLIYLNSFFVSVRMTKHYRWNVRLTQQMALLEETRRRLESSEKRIASRS